MRTVTVLELEKKLSNINYIGDKTKLYSIYVSDFDDYVEENKQYIMDWMQRNHIAPTYVYIEIYKCNAAGLESRLADMKLTYEKNTSQIDPIYRIHTKKLSDTITLIDEYYWLAAENLLMMFTTGKVEAECKADDLLITAHVPEGECVITIEHDGQGMQLLTAKEDFLNKEGIIKTLGNIHLEQWNKQYYGLR